MYNLGYVERLKILVVEDDPVYASFITEALRAAGHDVTLAMDGATARAQNVAALDAVVLDLRLPDESGYDIARALRLSLPSRSVIVLLTAELNPQRDAAQAIGIDIVLTKPIEEELVTRIIDHVRTQRERRLRSSAT
jgi:DNA-binding response OmpR family regulator